MLEGLGKDYVGSLLADLSHKPVGGLVRRFFGWVTGKAAETVEKVIAFNMRAEFVRTLMAKTDLVSGKILFPNILRRLREDPLRENALVTRFCEIIFEEGDDHLLEELEKSAKELKDIITNKKRERNDALNKLKEIEDRIKAHASHHTMREKAVENLEKLEKLLENGLDDQFEQMLEAVHHNPVEQWLKRVDQNLAGPLQAFADYLDTIPGAKG